jgi:FkbM family methyltransferase
MTHLSKILNRWLPPYVGEIQLADGVRFQVDSRQPAERELLFAGDRHRALSYWLKQHTPLGACCLDIGSNLGFYTLKFALWAGPQGRVAAFEANPERAQRIQDNIDLNHLINVEVIAKAVDDQPGLASFYLHPNSLLSSLIPRRNATETITVEKITLDEYVERQGWSRLDVIKIDVEGHDCKVILGAQKIIERFRPYMTFEFNHGQQWDAARQTFDFLMAQHYVLKVINFRTGKLTDFDWSMTPDTVNIVCSPVPSPSPDLRL